MAFWVATVALAGGVALAVLVIPVVVRTTEDMLNLVPNQMREAEQEALRYAPACALAAIIMPDLLMNNGHIVVSMTNPKLIAGIAATAFFLVKRNMLLTIFFGMAVYTFIRLGL